MHTIFRDVCAVTGSALRQMSRADARTEAGQANAGQANAGQANAGQAG